MPTAVLISTGQMAVMKITKIALGLASRKAASEIGSQASGGTVRSTWKIGSSPRMAQVDWPTMAPMTMPAAAARPKPMATRCSEVRTRQPRPISWLPLTKNGSRISSPASFQTCEGGGRVAPRPEQRISQTSRITRRVTRGGTTVASSAVIFGFSRAARLGRGAAGRAMTVARAGAAACVMAGGMTGLSTAFRAARDMKGISGTAAAGGGGMRGGPLRPGRA